MTTNIITASSGYPKHVIHEPVNGYRAIEVTMPDGRYWVVIQHKPAGWPVARTVVTLPSMADADRWLAAEAAVTA